MLPTAQEFRHMRTKVGLTQKDLAKKAGVSQALIARIEGGSIDTKLSTAGKILDALKTSPTRKKSLDIKDYMHSPVTYCQPSDILRRAISIMEEGGISQMPVMEGGKQVGSIVDTKIVKILSKKGSRATKAKISQIMAPPFPEIDSGAPIDKAIRLLGKSPAILVMNGPHVSGIITKADVLRMAL